MSVIPALASYRWFRMDISSSGGAILYELKAHKVINFFVDKIKELKRIDDRGPGLNDLEHLVLDEFDGIEDTFFVSYKEFSTEKYKKWI